MVVLVGLDLGIARKSQPGEGETRRLPTLVQRIPAPPLPAGGSARPARAPEADQIGGPDPATGAPPPSPSTSHRPPGPGPRPGHRQQRPPPPGCDDGPPPPARPPAGGLPPARQ